MLKSFIWESVVFPLDETVKKEAILLRREYHIKLPDSIIVATAKIHGLTLLTAD